MSRGKQRTKDYEFSRVEAKEDRRDRRQADADEKRARAPKSRGLRSQGDVGIIESDQPLIDNPRGRRAEPTRFDAMPIAGHERLPGYQTPLATGDGNVPDPPEPGPDPPAPMAPKPSAESDSAKKQRYEARDLRQASEDAVTNAIDDASEAAFEDAARDRRVASSDHPRRSKHEDAAGEDL